MTYLSGTGALRGLHVPRTGHVGLGGLGGLVELARLGPKIKYVRFICRLYPTISLRYSKAAQHSESQVGNVTGLPLQGM